MNGSFKHPVHPLGIAPRNVTSTRPPTMNTENIIRALAGSLVLASLALAHFVHPGFLLLTGFVGLNLLQSAFTGLCPAESILRRLRPSARQSPGHATPRPCCDRNPSA